MRVGYVLKKFPRVSETFILNEILELERQGVEVTVFSLMRPDDGRFHRRLADLRGSVVYLMPPKGQDTVDLIADAVEDLRTVREPLWAAFEDLLACRRRDTWSVLRQGVEVGLAAKVAGIDHLHAHFATVATQVARIASITAGCTFSFTCHAKDIYREGVEPDRFAALVDAAARVVTVCDANREHILGNLAPGRDDRVARVYNGIDLDLFHPRIREPQEQELVVGVGRLVEKKGFDDLIRAVAALQASGRSVRCVIVGDGDQREALETLAESSGAEVGFVGATTHDETRRYMASATVLALPCVIGEDGNRDALPTVLLEAIAMGLPVISTPIVGIDEIVDAGRSGVLVPPRDVSALTDAIGRLLGDSERRSTLAENGRARAERLFDLRDNVAALRSEFEQALKGCGAAGS